MESTQSRPLTRRKAEGLKRMEEEKRRRTEFQLNMAMGPRDLRVNLNSVKIKTEEPSVLVKMEPEPESPIPSSLGDTQQQQEEIHVVVKEEIEIPMDSGYPTGDSQEEPLGQAFTSNNNERCSCSEEISLLKDALMELRGQLAERDQKIQEVSDNLENCMRAKDLEIKGLSQRVEKLEQERTKSGALSQITNDSGNSLNVVVDVSSSSKDAVVGSTSTLEQTAQRGLLLGGRPQPLQDSQVTVSPQGIVNNGAVSRKEGSSQSIQNVNVPPLMSTSCDIAPSYTSRGNVQNTKQVVSESPWQRQQEEQLDDRVILLFPQVLKIIWEKFAKSKERNKMTYLNFNCRLVCQAWRKGMDELLTGSSSPLNINTKIQFRTRNPRETIDLVNSWLQLCEHKPSFPFPPRNLTIVDSWSCTTPVEAANCLAATSKFLEHFGNSIHVFAYTLQGSVSQPGVSLSNWYLKLRYWLLLMPHLQELTLHDGRTFLYLRDLTFEMTGINSAVWLCPFPTLEQLISFRMTGNQYSENMIYSALRVNSHVRDLHLHYLPQSVSSKIPFPPDLKNLVFGVSADEDVGALRSLIAPLESLKIQCQKYLKLDRGNLGNIFYTVERFGGSLKCLDMNVGESLISCRALNLRNLQKLTVWMEHVNTNGNAQSSSVEKEIINVISSLVSLQHLCIHHLQVERLGLVWVNWIEKAVKLSHRLRRIRKCLDVQLVGQLWNRLPALKQVEIVDPVYRRSTDKTFMFIRKAN